MKYKKHKNNLIWKIMLAMLVCLPLFVHAGNGSITSVSPSSGAEGDPVQISGLGIYDATKVLFGTTSTNIIKRTMVGTSGFVNLDVLVPVGATTGKVTVESKANGKILSPLDFTVIAPPATGDLKWYYINEVKRYVGPYDDQVACEAALSKHKQSIGSYNTLSSCIRKSLAEVQKDPKYSEIYDLTPAKVDETKQFSPVYTLLAPLGKLKTITTGNEVCTDTSSNISCYLNILFKIGIGICGALAVIMIVIGGIQYMGNESVFGKVEAKGKIFSALFGLLIALGAFALLNTIDPNLTGRNGVVVDQVEATITPLYDRGASDPKKANGESNRCTPVTKANSPCTVANLTPIFGAENAVAMSKICNMESSGTNATSSTDVCKPGNTPFSFGLFQVNLSANGSLAGSTCVDLFNKKVTGKDAIAPKYSSGFSCSLQSQKEALYNTCKNILLDPNKNLAIAKSLFTKDKRAWLGDKKYCASAFN